MLIWIRSSKKQLFVRSFRRCATRDLLSFHHTPTPTRISTFSLTHTHMLTHQITLTTSHPHTHTHHCHSPHTHTSIQPPFLLLFAASPSSPFSCSMTRKDFDIVWHWKKNSSLGSPHWFKACSRMDTCSPTQSGLLEPRDALLAGVCLNMTIYAEIG